MRGVTIKCLRCKAPLRPQARFCRRCGLLIAPASSDDNLASNLSPLYQPISRNAALSVPPTSSLTSQQTPQTPQPHSHPQSTPQNSAQGQRSLTMNVYGAKLVSVYTRETNGNIPSDCLRVSGAADGETISFEVVVEARAGWVLANSGAPYALSLVAFDIISGRNAEPCAAFTKTMVENFTNTAGNNSQWPEYKSAFPVTLTQAQADTLVGHVLQYTVTLISPPPGRGSIANIVSFIRSELFILV
jgi:hypothetical protein